MPDILEDELRRIAAALRPHRIPVIIGGGYGLLLWQRHVEAHQLQTLREVPRARATQDLDRFLTVELIADAHRMTALRDELEAFGYAAAENARYFQFERIVLHSGQQRRIKVDLLAPPPRDSALKAIVKADRVRVRPRGVKQIQAHTTPEAFTLHEGTRRLRLGGVPPAEVHLPHPFTFLLLKLYAFRDRKDDPGTDFGQYHAFDLYRIIAMLTEQDVEEVEVMRDRYRDDLIVIEAGRIVRELFGSELAPGSLAVSEHSARVGADLTGALVADFRRDLHDFLGAQRAG